MTQKQITVTISPMRRAKKVRRRNIYIGYSIINVLIVFVMLFCLFYLLLQIFRMSDNLQKFEDTVSMNIRQSDNYIVEKQKEQEIEIDQYTVIGNMIRQSDNQKKLINIPMEPFLISIGEFRITAYCPCIKCCEIWSYQHPRNQRSNFIQVGALGITQQANHTIAADTSVLPFGTVVYIAGQRYVVEDVGGAIKGNRIDIFFDTHSETVEYGVQYTDVFVLAN